MMRVIAAASNQECLAKSNLHLWNRLLIYCLYFPGEVERFVGNKTAIDNFKLMERDENLLLIGAT